MKQIGSDNPDFNIMVSCPPMLLSIERYEKLLVEHKMRIHCPDFTAVIPEEELVQLVPQFDGWIIGDDAATANVFAAGREGKLKAAVKWGAGVDNVDFEGAKQVDIPITNTPGMFSDEVADLAAGYVICLARKIIDVHQGVNEGGWPKPVGMSLRGKHAAVVGYGYIGREIVNRLLAFGMSVTAYDPFLDPKSELPERVQSAVWPQQIEKADYLVLACSLSKDNFHLVNDGIFGQCKKGLHIVNVARGQLIVESSLCAALESGTVAGAALDVVEVEPLQPNNPLRKFGTCIFGSHNGSNTQEAVDRTSTKAIQLIHGFLTQ